MRAIGLLVVLAGTAGACGGAESGPDAGAQLACSHFSNVAQDAADGVIQPNELRNKIREVESDASASDEPGIADAARRMLAAITEPIDPDAYTAAVGDFISACNASVG